jgi:hypothetical protein
VSEVDDGFQMPPQQRTIEETSMIGSTNLESGVRNFHDHCPKHGGREKTVIDTETQVQSTPVSKELSPPVESQVTNRGFLLTFYKK